jgi:predicted ATPase/DNA-binding CsgD family transcriptional regulator
MGMQDNIVMFPQPSPGERTLLPRYQLPAPLTPLVGREHAALDICTRLHHQEVRLLTLTGTAGVGKTRLGLQVATELIDTFADGVCFVSLAPLSDPELILPTLTQALRLPEASGQSPLEHLQAYLQDKHLLLLLDNFEQIADAAPLLVALLQSCPDLKIVVTSRALLRVRGEYEVRVSPLDLPDLKQHAGIETLAHNAAVTLFMQRAQAIAPDFTLTETNAHIIAAICTHLDGLPLAIELAAARIALLSPQQLLRRLEHRLEVLTGGAQDLPARQQTLRNTLRWSYDLLSPGEQWLFRLLSVFVGGCMLETVEVLCRALGDGVTEVLDGVQRLLDSNLIFESKHPDGEMRLMMLETIREYGQACLASSGEAEATRQAHAAYYLALAEEIEPKLASTEQLQWLERLEQEHDNLRAALSWLLEKEQIELVLRLGGALWRFWYLRGHLREGREALERILLLPTGQTSPLRAKIVYGAGYLAIGQGDYEQAEAHCREVLALFQEQGDRRGIAACLCVLGYIALQHNHYLEGCALAEQGLALARQIHDAGSIAFCLNLLTNIAINQGDYARANMLGEESIALCRAENDLWGLAVALWLLAQAVLNQGEAARARALLEESLVLCHQVSDPRGIPNVLLVLGQVALVQGEYAATRRLLEESLALFREVGDRQGIAWGLQELGRLAFTQGYMATARSRYEESLALLRTFSHPWLIAHSLAGLAEVVAAQGQLAWAARLWGAAQSQLQSIGAVLLPLMRPNDERSVVAVRIKLGEQAFASAWAEGRTMSLEQILANRETMPSPRPVLTVPPSTATAFAPPLHARLTPREMDVLRLLAQGLTSAQIAGRLVISLLTVNTHVRAIYSKLGVTSRSAATRCAIEHKLV